jgi:glutathione S-transferase
MRLYHHPMSSNARRAVMTAVHLGAPVDLVVVDLAKGEQRKPDFLKSNPNGKVPVLEDDGFVLWESRAIMQYLADKTPGQTLLPSDARGRADVNRWLFWCAAHMAPANTVLVYERFVKAVTGRGPEDPVEVARGEALVAQYAPVLDTHLADKTWVSQDRLTLADFSLAASFALAGPARLPIADYANLRAWLGRVRELEAWKRTEPPARG